MVGVEVSPAELVDHLEALGVATPDGITTSAYADFDHPLDLGSVALSLGFGELVRDAEFPGLIYEADDYEETLVVVFDDGTVFVDSAGSVRVQKVIEAIAEDLLELGLLEAGLGPDAEFELTPQQVPVPSTYEIPAGAEIADGKGIVDAEDVCPGCSHDLTGTENYCPECGLKLNGECRDCGYDLVGHENYCPECGTAVAGG